MKEHLMADEPAGHGLTAAYIASIENSRTTLEQEHKFQHHRDKRAGIWNHQHVPAETADAR